MYIGTCLFHSLTDTCKFALCTFTCVFFAECESRLFRKRRTVCPYFSDKIFGIVDLGIFRSNGFFQCSSLFDGNDTSVESECTTFR